MQDLPSKPKFPFIQHCFPCKIKGIQQLMDLWLILLMHDVVCSSSGVIQQQQAAEDPASTPKVRAAPAPVSTPESMSIIGVQESAAYPAASTFSAGSPSDAIHVNEPAAPPYPASTSDPTPGSSTAGGEQPAVSNNQAPAFSTPGDNAYSASSNNAAIIQWPRTRLQGV
jgi:hypothetical protein